MIRRKKEKVMENINLGTPKNGNTKPNNKNNFAYISLAFMLASALTLCGAYKLSMLFSVIAFITSLISFSEKYEKKTGITVTSLVLSILIFLASVGLMMIDDPGDDVKVTKADAYESTETPETESSEVNTETEETTENNSLSVGDSFEKSGLQVTLDAYNPEYTDYNEFMPPNDGYKYIEVSFTYENIGDSGTKYVSIYDCDCYADNTLCEQAYIGDNDFINANISAGRNVSFSVYYQVPVSAQSIELEYNSNSFWSTSSDVTFKLQ